MRGWQVYMLLAVSIQTQKKPASWVVGGGCDCHKAGGKEQMGYLGRNTSVLQQLSRHEFFRLHLNEMPSSQERSSGVPVFYMIEFVAARPEISTTVVVLHNAHLTCLNLTRQGNQQLVKESSIIIIT